MGGPIERTVVFWMVDAPDWQYFIMAYLMVIIILALMYDELDEYMPRFHRKEEPQPIPEIIIRPQRKPVLIQDIIPRRVDMTTSLR